MEVGSEAYTSALLVYQYTRAGGKGAALDSALDALGQRFARKSQKKTPDGKPLTALRFIAARFGQTPNAGSAGHSAALPATTPAARISYIGIENSDFCPKIDSFRVKIDSLRANVHSQSVNLHSPRAGIPSLRLNARSPRVNVPSF
jgi:hypothetical protein